METSKVKLMTEGDEKYKQVRAIKRGLDVLVALNALTTASIAALSASTGIHRTTMYRVLETLETLGYVRRSLTDDTYRLTSQVRTLSEGYDESERIASASSRSLKTLLEEIAWPSSVATHRRDAMIIRETTHGRGALFVHDVGVGTRSPVLTSALGRAYLAYCSDEEREDILNMVAASGSPEAPLARDAHYVNDVIKTTREAGYGFSFGESIAKLGSVAMPISSNSRILGCVNVVFLTGIVSRQSAVQKFVPALERAVATIQRNLSHPQ
jgi:IclR family mhp operon transcriptional activator